MTTAVVGRRAIAPATVLVFFAAAVMVRVALAGPARAASTSGALVFAVLLGCVAVISKPRTRLDSRTVTIGLLAAAVLVVPAWAHIGLRAQLPLSGFAGWAGVTVLVATAEEAFLRGALFDVVNRWRGADMAVIVAAVAFGLMHVPLYGWRALPLDTAVGLALGATRLIAGSWTAPAIAHVGADLVGWWLV
jgi:membrane protease YdiL (CAAX protease family)